MAEGVENRRSNTTSKLKIKRLGVEKKESYRRLPIGTLADLVVYSGFMNSQFDRNVSTPNLDRLRKLRQAALNELGERLTDTFKKSTDECRVEGKLKHYMKELKKRLPLIDTLPNVNRGDAMQEAFLFLADYKAVRVRIKSSKKAEEDAAEKPEPTEEVQAKPEQADEIVNKTEPPEEIEVTPEPCLIS